MSAVSYNEIVNGFKQLGYTDEGIAKLNEASKWSEEININSSEATRHLQEAMNSYVYCTDCKHFRLDDEEIPYCPYEEKECDIRDCEDSRPFKERPMYEKR